MKIVSLKFDNNEVPKTEQLRLKENYVTFVPKTQSMFREEKGEFQFCLFPDIVNEHSEWIDDIEI